MEEGFDFYGSAFKCAKVAVDESEECAVDVDSCFASACVAELDCAAPFAHVAFDFAASLLFVELRLVNDR